MDRMPAHLAHHGEVFSACREIIHCDSHSADGTKRYVADHLNHPGLTQIDHAPGLYQSWNHAIQQCTQDYIYISTIGDHIDLDGLSKMLALAHQENADLVITPPRFVEETGKSQPRLRWPIHNVISAYNVTTPRAIPAHLLFAEAIMHAPDGITGSAASCLFRTSFLKLRPFPLGYHGACDTAWGIRYILEARCAIHPYPVSTFLLHPKSYESNEKINAMLGIAIQRLSTFELRRRVREHARKPGAETAYKIFRELRMSRLSSYLAMAYCCKLKRRRKKLKALWMIDKRSWETRCTRNFYRKRAGSFATNMRALLEAALNAPSSK
jgi:hypothetical protein